MAWLSESGIIPLDNLVQVDPDLFKAALPEWAGYNQRDALSAGFKTRNESGLCCEVAQEAAMRMSKHVWVDGSLRDGAWYRSVFEAIRRRHPSYSIAIFHIVVREEEVFARAEKRAKAEGRHVPHSEIRDSLQRVPEAVEMLTPFCQFVATIDNSDAMPRLVEWQERADANTPPPPALGIPATPSSSSVAAAGEPATNLATSADSRSASRRHVGWGAMRRLFPAETAMSVFQATHLALVLQMARRWSARHAGASTSDPSSLGKLPRSNTTAFKRLPRSFTFRRAKTSFAVGAKSMPAASAASRRPFHGAHGVGATATAAPGERKPVVAVASCSELGSWPWGHGEIETAKGSAGRSALGEARRYASARAVSGPWAGADPLSA